MKSPISKFKVYGNSMSPTLKQGQEVLTFNWGKIHVGDVVVVKAEKKEIIKRITKINDSPGEASAKRGRQILIKGDNEKESTDSRHFGPIDQSQILGKVIYYLHGRNCPSRPAYSPRHS